MRIPSGILLLLLASATGCDGPQSSSKAPSQPTPPIPSPVTLSGYVYDTASRSVAGATVTVVDGTQAGLSGVSEANGRFSLSGSFESVPTIRIEKADYITATIPPASGRSLSFPFGPVRLEAVAAPVDLVGDYTLTVIANASCNDIPSDLRTRTYTATITLSPDSRTRTGTSLVLTAGGASFLATLDRFAIGVAGSTVTFSMIAGEFHDFSLVEETAPATYLGVYGYATVAAESSPVSMISTAFDGTIAYCAKPSGWNSGCIPSDSRVAYSSCDSQNHQMILNRR